jgi:hypothetical protein
LNLSVAEKPFESGNNMPFQRYRGPGPDFLSGNGKKGIFSRNSLLVKAKMPLPAFCGIGPERKERIETSSETRTVPKPQLRLFTLM